MEIRIITVGKIKEKYCTQDAFAEALGISRSSLSQRLNSRLEFSQDEIGKTMYLLELDKSDIPIYFFELKV